MPNDMRDRLIQLICCSGRDYDNYVEEQHEMGMPVYEDFENWLVDDLIAHGVVLPPCKVGDKVYVPSCDEEESWIDEYKVKYFYCSSKGINRIYIECGTMGNNFRPKDIGKTVFLTENEAKKAMSGRCDNG